VVFKNCIHIITNLQLQSITQFLLRGVSTHTITVQLVWTEHLVNRQASRPPYKLLKFTVLFGSLP